MNEQRRRFWPVEHTADLAFGLWGESEEALLLAGAEALMETLLGDGGPPLPLERRTLVIRAVDAEDRLVRFLNEVLLLALVDGFLTAEAAFVLTPPGALTAELWGEPDAQTRLRCELKSVTYHDLSLEPAPEGGVMARVVVDV